MRSAAEWRAVLAEVDQAGLCAHPVRLRGLTLDRSSGELVEGDLLVACKDRRAAVCPSCSRLYQADAWQLVAAGIRGGKGVSPSVVAHPQLFVTLTAPSFGPVHRSDVSGDATPAVPAPAQCGALPARSPPLVHAPPRRRRPDGGRAACAPSASTTAGRCSGTPTSPRCGPGPSTASIERWPGRRG